MEDTTTTDVTVDTSVATPSASTPDTSAVASPSTPSRPASMKEALEQTAAKRAGAVEGTDTIVPPVAPDGIQPASKRGPIPFDVHETSLKNAREKAATEATAQWEQQHGWAKTVQRERAEQALQLAEMVDRNPLEFIERAIAHLSSDPASAAQLRTLAARQLQSGRGQGAPAVEQLTPIPIELADGRVVNVLPADQLAMFRQQILAEAQQQFQPAMDAAKEMQQAKELAVQQHQADQFATGFMGDLKQLPQFNEHAAEMRAELARTKLETDHPAEVSAAMYRIYNRIVVPKLLQAGSAQTLASLKQKAVAQTEGPSRTATTPSARPKTPSELAKFMQQKHAERRG